MNRANYESVAKALSKLNNTPLAWYLLGVIDSNTNRNPKQKSNHCASNIKK